MKKKVFYWSPCLNPVGTVISTANSSLALSKFSNEYEVSIINTCGEWDKFKNEFSKNKVNVIDLNFKYYKFLPKTGYLQSRFSYIIIFLLSLFPLILLLKKKKPDILIAHLITSLPIIIFQLFSFHTNLILRISGMPKLNFVRKNFWKFCGSNIKVITCPTVELKNKIKKINIVNHKKIFYLPDAVLNISNYRNQLKISNKFKSIFTKDVKVFLAVGRLTKQKNFPYLINEFSKYYLENNKSRLVILGDGEEFDNLQNLIVKKKLKNIIYLLGRVENVLRYMKDSDAFILSSKWEEMGFVIIESALANLFIISSDCPNGPSEFLNNGQNGLLYENNKSMALYNALKKYEKIDDNKKKNDCVEIKKNSMKFSIFRHYKKIDKILNMID
jgi:glycosyltransferase involved in cell wall biosynthesis